MRGHCLALLLLAGCSVQSIDPPAAALAALSDRPARVTVEGDRVRLITGRFAANGANAEEAARGFFLAHAEQLGLESARASLALSATRHGRSGDYLRFAQQRDGLPVFDGEVVVHLDAAHAHVLSVNVATRPRASELVAAADLGAAAAERVALDAVKLRAPLEYGPETTPGIWAPERGAVAKAYRMRVSSDEPRAAWEVFVAASGEVLAIRNRLRAANGTAMVFDPNPVETTGDLTLRDNNDMTNAELDGARFAVTLPRLDGSGYTRGDYVDATTKQTGQRVNSATLTFDFTRDQSFSFEQANAYFHLDRVQDRIQTQLLFNNVNNRVQTVVVDAQTADNSFYDANTTKIDYGTGGVDDAEDAEIVDHEYGHSIQDNQVPGYGNGDEGAMGEGFGDYLSGSMNLALITADGHPMLTDPLCLGDWDSTAYSPPCLRRLDSKKHWPEAGDGEVHDDGEMWSASLWGLHDLFGADVSDTLVLEAQFAMSTNDSFQVASDLIVAADQNLFDGGHALAIERRLIQSGVSRHLTVSDAGGPWVTYPASLDNPRTNGTYPNNLDDTQSFTAAGATAIRVHFSQLDTELDNTCLAGACDNVYLTNSDGDLFAVLNGNQTNLTSPAISGDTVHLRLATDPNTAKFGYHVDSIDVQGPFDGGFTTPDGGAFDAGMTVDAGPADAGPVDSGTPDSGMNDAGMPDAGPIDAGVVDSGAPDAGPEQDAGARDSGSPDAGTGGKTKSGCGCNGGSTAQLWLIALVAFATLRRKSAFSR